jgi:hypothetical protein
LTINDVLFFQPHLILSEILNEQLLYDPLLYDPDIEDFETCSKHN